ncbi:MAG: TIGR02186 family protein, partial [Pseudomonadota bacterium]
MMRWALIALSMALAGVAKADDLSIWLTEPLVAIDSGFAGARIFVFGGVRPRAGADAGGAPDGVVVAVRGPAEDVPVRPKRRVGVFWIAGEPLIAEDAPAYYFVGGTSPLHDLVGDEERARRQLGAEHLRIAFAASP